MKRRRILLAVLAALILLAALAAHLIVTGIKEL